LIASPQLRSRLKVFGAKKRLDSDSRRSSVNLDSRRSSVNNTEIGMEDEEEEEEVIEKVDGMQINTSAGEFSVKW